MAKYVAILHNGVLTVHLPHTTGNYYTLCGEDGEDNNPLVDSVAADVPKGAKVDCGECLRIWQVCKRFTAKDFEAHLTPIAADVPNSSAGCWYCGRPKGSPHTKDCPERR